MQRLFASFALKGCVMSGNVIEVRMILQPWGFVVADSIVGPQHFIFPDPSGASSGPFEQHL